MVPRLGVLDLEVLVLELLSVDGLPSGAVARSEVSSLAHKPRYDPVEARALVVQRLAALADALGTRAQRREVLRGPWHNITVQPENHPAGVLSSNLNVKVTLLGQGRVRRDVLRLEEVFPRYAALGLHDGDHDGALAVHLIDLPVRVVWPGA